MEDRVTTYRNCPKCGGKETLECYEALSSEDKFDSCSKCSYLVSYRFEHDRFVVDEVKNTPEPAEPISLKEQIEESLWGLTGNDKSAQGSVDYTMYLVEQYVGERDYQVKNGGAGE